MPGTVKLHRVLKTKPEKIYKAFTDVDAMAKWIPPNGFYCKVHSSDVRVGGRFRMSFTNFTTGKAEFFGGQYLELSPNLIRYNDSFDDQKNLPGVMEVTVTMKPNLIGTELEITQSGIPDAIPVEFCYAGWQESLENLARLVEPEIPDA